MFDSDEFEKELLRLEDNRKEEDAKKKEEE